jgi:hypothetical protein
MKAITLWQPWASAVAEGIKEYETRSWSTKHRGKIAIHASVKPIYQDDREKAEFYGMTDMPMGAVVAIADLTDCILITDEFLSKMTESEIDWGDWRLGRYAWKLENVIKLKEPMKIAGKQGLWTVNIPGFEEKDLFNI